MMTKQDRLSSFGEDLRVAVIGAGGGVGSAFVEALSAMARVATIAAISRTRVPKQEKLLCLQMDIEDEASIEGAADHLKMKVGALDLVLVASGILHEKGHVRPEKSWRAIDPAAMEKVFRVNAIGPALVAKHFLPLLAADRKTAFAALSARVGSIADNGLGGWYGYRASKAALNMIIKTLSIELARKRPEAVCVGLHPGTVDTGLSKPFQANVTEGKLFTPAQSAAHLLCVLDGLSPRDTGGLFAWDGQRIRY